MILERYQTLGDTSTTVFDFDFAIGQVLLRDPSDDNVVPIVEELRRRLKPGSLNREETRDGNLTVHNDVEATEEDGIS